MATAEKVTKRPHGKRRGEEADQIVAVPAPAIASERPFWEVAVEISSRIRREEWEQLPTDASQYLDHYLYGHPKDEA